MKKILASMLILAASVFGDCPPHDLHKVSLLRLYMQYLGEGDILSMEQVQDAHSTDSLDLLPEGSETVTCTVVDSSSSSVRYDLVVSGKDTGYSPEDGRAMLVPYEERITIVLKKTRDTWKLSEVHVPVTHAASDREKKPLHRRDLDDPRALPVY